MQKLNHLYLVKQYLVTLLVLILVSTIFQLLVKGQSGNVFDAFLGVGLWISTMWWLMTSPQETLKNCRFLTTLPLSRKSIFRSRYLCCMLCVSLLLVSFCLFSLLLTIGGVIESGEFLRVLVRSVFALAIFSLIFSVTLSSDTAVVRVIVTVIGGLVAMIVQAKTPEAISVILVATVLLVIVSGFFLRYGERKFCQLDLN